ncbi:MAG: S46 family peptidase, partial [Balneolaceae bacterium]
MKNLRIWTLLLTAILLSSCTTQEIVIEKEIIKTGKEGSGSELLTTFEPVESSILDNGRMWTFEYAPREYFEETYNFEATDAWFERARLSSVRLPNCSGSFISPDGLVMTNHHCAREMVSAVSQEGEDLLVDGFYAETMEDERPIPDYYLDQLVEIRDVTDEILDVVDAAPAEEQAAVREQKISEVQQALTAEFEADGDKSVQVVSLFNGGRYSAYIFRRFTDVRMVMAPELQIG